MASYYSRKLNIKFREAKDRLSESLKEQGFNIISSNSLTDALKEKLNVNFRNYEILTAFNPELLYKAITLDSHVGVILPSHLVVQEHENGEVEITASCCPELIDEQGTTQITSIACETKDRLRHAMDNVRHKKPHLEYSDALPSTKAVDRAYTKAITG